MALYCLTQAGAPLDDVRDFAGPPPDLSHKGMAWLAYSKVETPIDLQTHRKGAYVKAVESGAVVDRLQAIALTDEEKRGRISSEAERRLAEGLTLAGGVQFRCDNGSLTRIQGMAIAPDAAFPLKFRTSAGVTVTINSRAEAEAVRDQVANYVGAVLKASDTLQVTPPVDFLDDRHWP